MRKSLSLLLAIAMVFSMFSSLAFAADEVKAPATAQEKYDALAAKGIFAGMEDGSAGLDQAMNRAQFARVAALILGLEGVSADDTSAVTAKPFSDVELGLWYTDEIAAVKDAGVFVGNTDGTFNPTGNINVQELAVVVSTLLGLEEVDGAKVEGAADWAAGYIQAIINAAIDFPTNYKQDALRSDLASLAFAAYTYVEAGKVPVVTTATKVATVSATNVKQIFVTFDGEVLKASAEEVSNYSTDAGAVKSASLSEDLKTVTLTLADLVTMTNQTEYKVSVLKVKAGTAVIEAKDVKFTVLDNTLPVVNSVTSLGNKALKLNVSEPVKSASSASIKIDDKSFFGTITTDGSTITLKPYNPTTVLTNADHKITVSKIEDHFGLKSLEQTLEFTVVEDKAAPVVVEVSATLETATIVYDEDIDPDTVATSDFHFLVGTDKKNPKAATVSGKKVTLDFTNNVLPAYATTLYVGQIADYSGNATASAELALTATVDQSRPEVADVKLSDSKLAITVKYNKNVAGTVLANYSIKDKDAKVVSIKEVTGSDKTFVITLYAALPAGANTLSISGVADTTALKNVILPFSTVINAGDTTAPTVDSASATNRQIVVNFSETMSLSSLANADNYLIEYAGSYRKLPAGTEITPILDGKSVLIVLAEKIDTTVLKAGDTVTKLQVMGVEDVAGNKLSTYFHVVDLTTAIAAAEVMKYDGNTITQNAILEDGETIKVKFNQPIGVAAKADFTITGATISTATANGTNIVTLKLSSNIGTSGATITALNVATGNAMKSVTGNSVKAGVVSLKDKVAPKVQLATGATQLSIVQQVTSADILLPFSETLGGTEANYAHDLIVTRVSDNKVLEPLADYATTVAQGSNIKITILAVGSSKYTVAVKSGALYITDIAAAGNKAASSATYETISITDGVVPTITSVTSATYSASTTGVLVLTVVGASAVGDIVDATKITMNDISGGLAYTLNTSSNGVVTNATTLTITLSTADIQGLIAAGFAGNDYTVNVADGVIKDTAGHVSAAFSAAQLGKVVTSN